jgi:hypothetical protein
MKCHVSGEKLVEIGHFRSKMVDFGLLTCLENQLLLNIMLALQENQLSRHMHTRIWHCPPQRVGGWVGGCVGVWVCLCGEGEGGV